MTVTAEPQPRSKRDIVAHVEGSPGPAVGLAVEELVPSHLLDGGEIVHFAIKPSPWFVLLLSLRWVGAAVCIACIALSLVATPTYRSYILQGAILFAGAGLGWATLEWVSRLYVLTNRRVMSIRGVVTAEMFDCPLDRIQHTRLSLSPTERVVRVGTIAFHTAGQGDRRAGSWRIIARPLEVHEKLRQAIARAQHRGSNGI